MAAYEMLMAYVFFKGGRDFKDCLENSNIFMEPKTTELKSKADTFLRDTAMFLEFSHYKIGTPACYFVKCILCLYGRHL